MAMKYISPLNSRIMTDQQLAFVKGYINTPIADHSAEQIDLILAMLKDANIEVNAECEMCIVERALRLYNKEMKKRKEQGEVSESEYVLKENVNVIFRGILINAATITDEKAEEWIKMGFPLMYFEKTPNLDTKEDNQ